MESQSQSYVYANNFIQEAIVGLLTGFFILTYTVASASIIFLGSLNQFLPLGVTSALFGAAISNFIVPTKSSIKGVIAWTASPLVAILSITFGRIAVATPPDMLATTIKVTILLLTLTIGVLFLILGTSRISKLLDYIPYPVVAGFIVGTAWFLLKGTVQMLLQQSITWMTFVNVQNIMIILPPAFFGFFVAFVGRFIRKKASMPMLMIGGIIVMYIFFAFEGGPLNQGVTANLFLFKPSDLFIFTKLSDISFQKIYWPSILQQINYLITILIIAAFVQALNVNSLEVETNQKIDFGKQSKIEGVANIIIGLLGGLVSTLSFTGTAFNHVLGGKKRTSSYVAAMVCLIVLIFIPHILNYLPKFIVAGVLFEVCFNMIALCLFDIWKKISWSDYLIILSILGSTIAGGLILGIVVGLILTCVSFAFKYGSLSIIKYTLSGGFMHSTRKYDLTEERILSDYSNRIYIYKLQGFLFFGATNAFYETIVKLLQKQTKHPLEYIILDFELVSGIDSSVSFKLIMIERLLAKHNIELVFVNCRDELLKILQKMRNNKNNVLIFEDLDHALEWWEKSILKRLAHEINKTPKRFTFESIFSNIDDKTQFLSYLTKMELPADSFVCHQGDQSDSMFLFESGKITVYIELADGKHKRVFISSAPTIVGEVGFFKNSVRTATVITDKPSVIYKLTRKDLELIEKESPELVIRFLTAITSIISERLVNMDKAVDGMR